MRGFAIPFPRRLTAKAKSHPKALFVAVQDLSTAQPGCNPALKNEGICNPLSATTNF